MNNDFIKNLTKLLDEKKAEQIEVIDMSTSDYIADNVVVATALNGKHADALMRFIEDFIRTNGESILFSDSSDDWVVVDLGDVLVHLISQEQRKIYRIEEFLEKYKTSKKEY